MTVWTLCPFAVEGPRRLPHAEHVNVVDGTRCPGWFPDRPATTTERKHRADRT